MTISSTPHPGPASGLRASVHSTASTASTASTDATGRGEVDAGSRTSGTASALQWPVLDGLLASTAAAGHSPATFQQARGLTAAELTELCQYVGTRLAPLAGPEPDADWRAFARRMSAYFAQHGVTVQELQALDPLMQTHDSWAAALRQALDASRTGLALAVSYLLRTAWMGPEPEPAAREAADARDAARPQPEAAGVSVGYAVGHAAGQGAVAGLLYHLLGPLLNPAAADWEYGRLPPGAQLPPFVVQALLRESPGVRQNLAGPLGQATALTVKNAIRGALCTAAAGRLSDEEIEQVMVSCDLFVAALTQPLADPVAELARGGGEQSPALAMLLRGEAGWQCLVEMVELSRKPGWSGAVSRATDGAHRAMRGAKAWLGNMLWQVTPEFLSSWVTGDKPRTGRFARALPPLLTQNPVGVAVLRMMGFTAVLAAETALLVSLRQALQTMPPAGREALVQALLSLGMLPVYLAGSLFEQRVAGALALPTPVPHRGPQAQA